MGQVLDTKGLNCPLPVLKTKRTLKNVPVGEILTVFATDPASTIDFRHFCMVSGHEMVEWPGARGVFTFVIRRTS
jgi:tRNA 2-thiouridine synthesizing protein A